MKNWLTEHVALGLLALASALPLSAFPFTASAQVIVGHVTDDRTSRPAVDHVVRLVQMGDSGQVVLDESTTDGKGMFTVVAPTAGDYLLTFGKTAPRVQRVSVAVAAGSPPEVREFVLPIQRSSDLQPYVDADVDSALKFEPRSRLPRYPTAQLAAQQAGTLFTMFVIDTTGRVEKTSVRIFAATHIDFAKETDLWLREARFRVAKVGGVPVREQVCLPMAFKSSDEGRRQSVMTDPVLPATGLANSARALCARAIVNNGSMTTVVKR